MALGKKRVKEQKGDGGIVVLTTEYGHWAWYQADKKLKLFTGGNLATPAEVYDLIYTSDANSRLGATCSAANREYKRLTKMRNELASRPIEV